MSLSRSRRTNKAVNYSTIENNSDDDDFSDFTPPAKKIKESKKKRESKKDMVISDATTACVKPPCRDKSPKQRLSLEERKFQRDMELALVLSATDSDDFQGFDKENENLSENLEFFSPIRNSVVAVEVHSVPSKKEEKLKPQLDKTNESEIPTPCKEKADVLEIKIKETEELIEENELRPKIVESSSASESVTVSDSFNGFNEKRQRKKVNFIEDDSDSLSDDEIRPVTASETDESDYFPSPTKSKKKKETKRTPKKNTKKKEPPSSKSVPVRKPLKDKQNSLADTSVNVTKSEPVVNMESSKAISTSKSNVDVGHKSPLPLKSNSLCTNKTREVSKISFKSPAVNSSFNSPAVSVLSKSPAISSLSNSNSSPKAPSRIGLRLGLSRKISAKPLHPNASVN